VKEQYNKLIINISRIVKKYSHIFGIQHLRTCIKYIMSKKLCKVRAMQTSSKIFFFVFFLHHSIGRELLIVKNYFLASLNASLWLKNTKNLKWIVFFEKHIFSENMQNFLLSSIFQIQHQKLNTDKLLDRFYP
jgi:hypothetical protein